MEVAAKREALIRAPPARLDNQALAATRLQAAQRGKNARKGIAGKETREDGSAAVVQVQEATRAVVAEGA